ncbi:hypothetical protein CDAR_248891 [Caerostris darwini]|uniref:Uncharacterized protein n=1 Tax=Caerostris darwini TaxID=1538125 RepID=A0AAV4R8D9_9ARAC|nr:hypothetical protein CDAR_248891 [Caerostris darwini]
MPRDEVLINRQIVRKQMKKEEKLKKKEEKAEKRRQDRLLSREEMNLLTSKKSNKKKIKFETKYFKEGSSNLPSFIDFGLNVLELQAEVKQSDKL